jgi:hypothetical protein
LKIALSGDKICGYKLRFPLAVIIVLSVLFTIDYASANWYAGNRRLNAYGVKANIWTPTNPIYIEEDGQSNWVSLPRPYWIQSGWRYFYGWSSPKSYVEFCSPPCQNPDDRQLFDYEDQNWGSIKEYKVDHYQSNTWCASIAGVLKRCEIITSAPNEMQVLSEIHLNPNNELDTRFSAVYYRTQNGTWFLFDQTNWREDYPYKIQKDQLYYFRTYRETRLFLPFIPRP